MLRIKPASETLNHLLTQLDKFGISRIADLTYLDSSTNLFIYSAMRPSAKSLTSSMGKGITIPEAKCSALMESIETFYAEELKPEITNTTLNQIIVSNELVLNVNNLTNYVSIDEDFPIDWCTGKLFRAQKNILIPHCFLSLDSNQLMTRLVGQNSDGLASGNSFEEAMIFSFWELNERISLKNEKMSLSLEDENFCFYAGNSLETNYFLYQNHFDIPVVGCHIKNKNPLENNKIFAGYACDSNIYNAAKRALFEAIQSKTGIISGLRDDINNDCYVYTSKYKREISLLETQKFPLSYMENGFSVLEEFKNIKKLLSHFNKDIAYYCYNQDEITVLKSFLVDAC